jgi:hypothetical protein
VNTLHEAISAEKELKKLLLDYKELEIAWEFLGHLNMTLEIMAPYLKGFHLTLSAHHNQRDADGWKITDCSWKIYIYQS